MFWRIVFLCLALSVAAVLVSRLIAANLPARHRHPHIVFPVRVEPRSYFANERTMLLWFEMATILTVLGAALQASRNSFAIQSAGLALSIPAAAIVVHALRMYVLRFKSLERKSPRHFEDGSGALWIVALLTGLVVSNVAVGVLTWQRQGPGEALRRFVGWPINATGVLAGH